MNNLCLFLFCYFILIDVTCGSPIHDRLKVLRSKTSTEDQTLAVQMLIGRLFGNRSDEFHLTIKQDKELDAFVYKSVTNGKIDIEANSGIALAAGVYHFLKYHCNIHVSWSGDQLNLPSPLPKVSQPVKIKFHDKFRYYQNVCTSSYSFAFWDWARWEKEIDWMALNGINFPLAFTGQEGIWQMVYKELGLTQEELDQHFGGAAFLAWQRMGNLDKWGGPLPVGWYENQLELQKKILKRMRSLGMVPILPGFAGHVPKALVTRLYPNANYTKSSVWVGFDGEYSTVLLNPVDPLFQIVGKKFIQKQTEVYNGTDHAYNADVFNEEKPPNYSAEYMFNSSQAIFQTMQAADPNAVWVLQGWTFLQSFWNESLMKAWFRAVPLGRLIILDLASELNPVYTKTDGYYGYPFIWCMIENFGGVTRLFGVVERVMSGVLNARTKYPNNMIGTGMTPEGINQNHLNFEIMNEMAWRRNSVDIVQFGWMYAQRRYGELNDDISNTWAILMSGVFNVTSGIVNGGTMYRITTTRPYLTDKLPLVLWYDPTELLQAWSHLIEGAKKIPMSDALRHDLVRVGTQAMEDLGTHMYTNLISAFHKNSSSEVRAAGNVFLDLLHDMNTLYGADKYSLLGTWLESAKSFSNNEDEKLLLEFNARNQITIWGPSGQITDYANKNWAGLVQSYYYTRWKMFMLELCACIDEKKPYNEKDFHKALLKFEESWSNDTSTFPKEPEGNVLDISEMFYKKYSEIYAANKQQVTDHWNEAKSKTMKGERGSFKNFLNVGP